MADPSQSNGTPATNGESHETTSATATNGHTNHVHEDSDHSEDEQTPQVRRPIITNTLATADGPAPEQISADGDLLEGLDDDTEDIDLVHCRVKSISALSLSRFKSLLKLCLRQNEIEDLHDLSVVSSKLTDLDLYDNQIAHIRGLDHLTELESLDLSFNKIKHLKNVKHLTKLKDLYFVQNKIGRIEELDGLSSLRNLELGANRIRVWSHVF
jgi:protein phosphatase 1 regulatory subunit 7